MHTPSERRNVAWPIAVTLLVPLVLFAFGTRFVPEGDAGGLGFLIVLLGAVEVLAVLGLTFWIGSREPRDPSRFSR